MATLERSNESESKGFDGTAPTDPALERHGLKETLEQVERDLILNALRASHGNKAQAARELGITERLIGLRVRRLGIDWRSLRLRRHMPGGAF